MTKRVLITGGTGYLGRNLIESLIKENLSLYALVRAESNRSILPSQVKPVEFKELEDLDPIDYFIHVATAYGRKGENQEEIFNTNKNLPLKILEIIGHDDLVILNTDTSLPRGLNAYSTSKKEFLDELEKNYSHLKVMNMICEQFYGPNDGTFVSFVSNNLKEGTTVEMTEGLQRRDFIFVKDVVSAFDLVRHKSSDLPYGLNHFEVGSGEALTIQEIGKLICHVMNKDQALLKWGVKPMRDGEIMLSVANNSKLRELGWSPSVSLEEGLRVTLEGK